MYYNLTVWILAVHRFIVSMFCCGRIRYTGLIHADINGVR